MNRFDTTRQYPRSLGRRKVRDAASPYALTYRMPAGFPGDVSRFPRAVIDPCLVDPTGAYALQPGMPVVVNPANNGVRPLVAGDNALTRIYGIVVRVFPEQQTTGGMTSALGNSSIPGPTASILRSGYIIVPINGTPAKDGQVFIWVAASAAPHVQGGWETAASGGNTITLPLSAADFNGGIDGSGIGELMFNI
jgi:hypothetical protein